MKRTDSGYDIFIIAAAALFGALCYVMPRYLDDLMFSMDTYGMPYGLERLSVCWEIVCRHTGFDCVRVANFAAGTVLGVIPPWLFAISAAGIIYMSLRLLPEVCCPDRSGTAWSWVAVACAVLLLPWYDNIFAVSYFMNYAGSTAMIFFMLWCLRRAISGHALPLWISVPACFLSGWCHEGFSMPLAVGLVAAVAIDRRIVTRQSLAVGLSFAAGTIFPLLFPAIWHRSGTMECRSLPPSWIAAGCGLAFAGIAATTVVMLTPRLRRRVDRRQWAFIVMFALSAAVSFGIALHFTPGPRSMWIPQLMGIATLLSLLPSLRLSSKQWMRITAKAVSALLVLTNLSAALYCEFRFRREFDDISSEVAANGTELFYHDRETLSPSEEWLVLGKVSRECFGSGEPMADLARYYSHGKLRMISIVPTELRDFDPSEATRTDSSGLCLTYRGHHIVAHEAIISSGSIDTEAADGSIRRRRVTVQPFRDTDGTEWKYLYFAPSAFPGSDNTIAKVILH